jgi:hypothetical protein
MIKQVSDLEYTVNRPEEWQRWEELLRQNADPNNYTRDGIEYALLLLRQDIEKNGLLKPLVLKKGTNQIIEGNRRCCVLRSLDVETVECEEIDVSDSGNYEVEQAIIDFAKKILTDKEYLNSKGQMVNLTDKEEEYIKNRYPTVDG